MKVGSVPVLLLFLAAASQQQASATVATLGVSKQTFSHRHRSQRLRPGPEQDELGHLCL